MKPEVVDLVKLLSEAIDSLRYHDADDAEHYHEQMVCLIKKIKSKKSKSKKSKSKKSK